MGADKLAENTQTLQNLSAQFAGVCQSTKNWDFDGKRLHWALVVRGHQRRIPCRLFVQVKFAHHPLPIGIRIVTFQDGDS
jgi:hypothetical protein